jgi:hypothetical protein
LRESGDGASWRRKDFELGGTPKPPPLSARISITLSEIIARSGPAPEGQIGDNDDSNAGLVSGYLAASMDLLAEFYAGPDRPARIRAAEREAAD